jgi:hypothetical protein
MTQSQVDVEQLMLDEMTKDILDRSDRSMAKQGKMSDAQYDEMWEQHLLLCRDVTQIADPSTRWTVVKLRLIAEFKLPVPRNKRFAPAVREFALRELKHAVDTIHRDRFGLVCEAIGWAVALSEKEVAQEVLLKLPVRIAQDEPEFERVPECVAVAFAKLFNGGIADEYRRLKECAYLHEQHELMFDEMRDADEEQGGTDADSD